MIIEHAQRNSVDRAVGQPVQGPAQIIEPVVGVDSRNNGDLNFPAQNGTGQVGTRAVAVNDLKALGANHLHQTTDSRSHRRLHDDCINAEFSRILSKLSLAEADKTHLFRFSKTVQQRQHMRFGTADVTAGDQMQYLHTGILIFELPLVSCGKIL